MKIPDVFGLKEAAIAAGVALVVGLAAGVYLAHLFYSPRLALKDAWIQQANGRIVVLGQDIKDQNEAIDKLQLAAADRAKQAAAALQKAQIARVQAEHDAAQILAAQPAPGVDRCTAASDLIRQELAR